MSAPAPTWIRWLAPETPQQSARVDCSRPPARRGLLRRSL